MNVLIQPPPAPEAKQNQMAIMQQRPLYFSHDMPTYTRRNRKPVVLRRTWAPEHAKSESNENANNTRTRRGNKHRREKKRHDDRREGLRKLMCARYNLSVNLDIGQNGAYLPSFVQFEALDPARSDLLILPDIVA